MFLWSLQRVPVRPATCSRGRIVRIGVSAKCSFGPRNVFRKSAAFMGHPHVLGFLRCVHSCRTICQRALAVCSRVSPKCFPGASQRARVPQRAQVPQRARAPQPAYEFLLPVWVSNHGVPECHRNAYWVPSQRFWVFLALCSLWFRNVFIGLCSVFPRWCNPFFSPQYIWRHLQRIPRFPFHACVSVFLRSSHCVSVVPQLLWVIHFAFPGFPAEFFV